MTRALTRWMSLLSRGRFLFPLLQRQRLWRSGAAVAPQRTYSSGGEDESRLYVRSALPEVQAVTGKTAVESLWENVLQWGDAVAFECSVTGRKYTFQELYKYSRGFSASLTRAGLKRGDVVGIVLPNIPEYPICLFGIWEAGCVISPVNPAYTGEEIKRQLEKSGASCVITIEHFLEPVISAMKTCPTLKTIVVVGEPPEGCLSFGEMIKTDSSGYDFLRGSEIDMLETVSTLPFSSGTTGPPKGVMLTHSNFATNYRQYVQPDVNIIPSMGEGEGEQQRLIGLLPFFHVFGFSIMLLSVSQGAHTMTLPRFEPQLFTDTIKKQRPTVMHLVTPLINFMVQSPEITKEDLASTHSILAAAAPIGSELINKILDKAGRYIFFQEGYGMTELTSACTVLRPSTRNRKTGSCGTNMSSIVSKVIDPVTGRVLGPGERGELCVQGPNVMKGYFKDEKATRETIDSEGWLHTGDICYYDEEKHFYIVDRLKELIKVKGFQVAPSELEDVIRGIPDVEDVAVIGVPDEISGELPRAYIVKKSERLDEATINNYLGDKLSSFKQLKGGIEFISAIPKAPSGKILRRELLAAYKKEFGIET